MRTIIFRNSAIGSLALQAYALRATMEETVAEPKNDTEFVKQFVAKEEAKEAAEKVAREKPAPAGKPKPAAKGDEGKPAPVSKVKEKAKDDDADPDEDDPAAGGGEGEEEEVDEVDPDADPGEDDPDVDEDDPAEKEEKEDKDDDSEFGKRARDAKLPTSIDDLPEAGRPLVAKRLKEMESGFTRLMQKQAEFRTEQREFRTEERYRETHKVEWLVHELLKDPKLEEQVAQELGKLRDDDSPYIREAATVVAKDHRAKAAKDIADQEAEERKESDRLEREESEQSEWIQQRGSQVESLARKACTRNGIQFDRGVEAAIAYEIAESEQGDIDDTRIAEIVKEMADERGASTRAVRREERKRHVQGKTDAARAASPLRPGQGRAGGATSTRPKKEPTLEENMTAFAEKHFPGEPS